ncbi:MAG: hypothetical protein KDA55_17145, partial [Planctomycetales bacterium]|nr:hypothetical protein [Planctomycetales bacterium]
MTRLTHLDHARLSLRRFASRTETLRGRRAPPNQCLRGRFNDANGNNQSGCGESTDHGGYSCTGSIKFYDN